ncbi:CRPV-020 [Crowpox virus]|nr:CRPV-020 [Crowpox virus]
MIDIFFSSLSDSSKSSLPKSCSDFINKVQTYYLSLVPPRNLWQRIRLQFLIDVLCYSA